MEALRSLSCRAGCSSRVSLLSVPMQGWLLSALDRELKHRCRLKTTIYGPQRAVDCDVNRLHVWASTPERGTGFSSGD